MPRSLDPVFGSDDCWLPPAREFEGGDRSAVCPGPGRFSCSGCMWWEGTLAAGSGSAECARAWLSMVGRSSGEAATLLGAPRATAATIGSARRGACEDSRGEVRGEESLYLMAPPSERLSFFAARFASHHSGYDRDRGICYVTGSFGGVSPLALKRGE